MEYLDVFLVSIGGTTTALLVVGFLSRSLIGHFFTKEMESYKSRLSRENSIELEAIKAELARSAKDDDRATAYEQVMQKYKGPLLHAVYDLQSRLYNILAKGFIQAYYTRGNDSEKAYVVNNTVFVVAQYFAWTEIIRREIQFIDFRDAADTKKLSLLRDSIYGLWQTDTFSDPFRVWAGEQRGIGELMIEDKNNQLTCIGYAAFLRRLENNDEPLFNTLQSTVESLSHSPVVSFPRLREIQHALIDILAYLDPDYIRFPSEHRQYAP